jgi:hypothetical protein
MANTKKKKKKKKATIELQFKNAGQHRELTSSALPELRCSDNSGTRQVPASFPIN